MDVRPSIEGQRPGHDLALAWLHLGVLWAFAFAQPLFGVLSDSPEFFVARRNTAGDIVVLACALVLIPPSVLTAIEALFVRMPPTRRVLHCAFVATLAAAFALQVLTDLLGAPAGILVALAVLLGVVAGVAYARVATLRTVLTVLSPAPLLFLGSFLLLSPVSDLVLPQSDNAVRGARGGTGAPVVMIVFDEFSGASLLDPHGRIDRARFPNFARLARHATWYRNATTVADRTERAVPALLTGRLPDADALAIAADQPHNLFALLGERYEFRVIEPATDLCPQRLCGHEARPATGSRLRSLVSDLSVVSLHLLLPGGLAEGLPPIDRTFGDFRGQGRDRPAAPSASSAHDIPVNALVSRVSSFDAFLRGLGRGRRTRTLHFIHVALPHRPWQYLPDGREYRLAAQKTPPARESLQQYMLQTVYVDRLLRRVLARLKRVGLYDRAALVVTADHGIAFQPGSDPRLAIPQTLGEIGGVPLFMKAPGQRTGRIDDRNIHTVDVLPMLASQLELELPWKTDDRPAPGEWHDVAVATPFRTITRMSFPEWLRLRDAAARRIHGSFGPGVEGLFQLGVDGELVGRSVRDFPAQPANALRADLDTFGQLDDVDPTASPLPVAVSGTLEGSTQAHERLAVSLNGIVAGTTHSHKVGDDVVFNAVVLPATLRAGSNTVEVWAIRDGSNGPALAPLRTAQPKTYDLVERDDHDSVHTPSGKSIPVSPGAAKGYIEVLDQAGGTVGSLRVAGWALNSHDTPVDKLVVFEGNRFLGVSLPGAERPDVVEQFGAKALKSGFSLEVPAAGLYGPDVRVFAIAGDRASELKRGGSLDSAN